MTAPESIGSAARGLIVPVYLPWLGVSLTLGMLTVALPLHLENAGVGLFALSVVLASAGVGSALTGVPSGTVVARLGSARSTVVGVALTAVATLLTGLSTIVVLLVGLQLVAGFGQVLIRVSNHTQITTSVRVEQRGRLLSGMGGLRRLGVFVGPVVAGIIIDRFGFSATFVVAAGLVGVGLIPLLRSGNAAMVATSEQITLRNALAGQGRRLMKLASGPVLIMMARRGRVVVLPLIGVELALSPTEIGLLVAVGAGADLALFPVSGLLMDRFGRLWAIVPAFSLMAVGLILLGLATTGTEVVVAGIVIGVGNGLSAGTMLTLGSDLAPKESPGPFLAGFAALQDWGQVLGPVVVGWVAAVAGLSASAVVLGAGLFVGLGLVVYTVGETEKPIA